MEFLFLASWVESWRNPVSNNFELERESDAVGPQVLGAFLDAGLLGQRLRRLQTCVPTEALDFEAQESCGYPIESFKTGRSNIPSDDQPLRAWSSLPGLRSLKIKNSVGASPDLIGARPIDFSAMNFDSSHRLSRRLSPTGSCLFTLHNLVGSVVPTDRGRFGTTAPT